MYKIVKYRDWTEYRKLPDLMQVDFHWANEERRGYYHENMQLVYDRAFEALQEAQLTGKKFILFTHGSSTSRLGKTTSRSQVRKLMRSKDATPYLIRKECIQHDSVFVAAIRPLPVPGI